MTDPRILGLSHALGLGGDPDPLLARLRAFYREIDREVQEAVEPLALPCGRGCDGCCRDSVFLSAIEFLLVANELVTTRSRTELQIIHDEMLRLAAKYEDELEMLETLDAGPERDEVASRVRFDCAFLDADGACTVYAVRELNARMFGQTWDGLHNDAYGCNLTHERLKVIRTTPHMIDARKLRQRLRAAFPGTSLVRVYPAWFQAYGEWLVKE